MRELGKIEKSIRLRNKLLILKHNHHYVDNKLSFRIKTSLSTINSSKNLNGFWNSQLNDTLLVKGNAENNQENEGGENFPLNKYILNRKDNTFSPLVLDRSSNYKPKSKSKCFWQADDPKHHEGAKIKIKCKPVLFIEKKRMRAQQIRAQSYVLHKIKKRIDKREKRKSERRWNVIKSMELNSK